jgi:hypothetical protein
MGSKLNHPRCSNTGKAPASTVSTATRRRLTTRFCQLIESHNPLVRELCHVAGLPSTSASLSLRYAMGTPGEHPVSTQVTRDSRHCKLYRHFLW